MAKKYIKGDLEITGTLTNNGQSVGGDCLYKHNCSITTKSENITISFSLISNKSSTFNNFAVALNNSSLVAELPIIIIGGHGEVLINFYYEDSYYYAILANVSDSPISFRAMELNVSSFTQNSISPL